MQEEEAKAAAPSEAEVAAFYEQNKQRLPPGMTREQALAEIQKRFRERNVAQARARYRRELLDRAGARVRLEPPRSQVAIPAGAPAQGPEQAPVTIIQFSDYQCPYCQRSEATVQEVLSRYAGKVRLVHRDFPLDGHPRAFPTSRAAYCAGDQGRFWEYHRGVFLKPSDLSEEDLKRRAGELGLDAAAFAACLASDRHDATIRAAFDQGVGLGVTGTPTFFINGRLLVGARPFENFKSIIDEELAGS
jgi:protein-disulfide isomerase